MSKQDDDALPLPPSSKEPAAEDPQALSVRHTWLQQNINWQALRRYAYTITRNANFADDIVQDLYDDMLEWSPGELHGLHKPQSYASQAVRYRIFNWKTRYANRRTSLDDYLEKADDSASLEDKLETEERIKHLLAELPEHWRVPLVLSKFYGYTAEEIALRSGLSADAVRKRVARALYYIRVTHAAPPPDSLLRKVKNFIHRKEPRHD